MAVRLPASLLMLHFARDLIRFPMHAVCILDHRSLQYSTTLTAVDLDQYNM